MDITRDRYFILGRRVLSFLGIWYTQTYKERFFRICIVTFMLFYSVLAQLCQVLTLDFDLRSIVTVLQIFIPFVCTATIYYAVVLHLITVQSVFTFVINDWQQVQDEAEVKIMEKHIIESKLFTKISGSMFCIFGCTLVFPFIRRIIVSTNEKPDITDTYPIFSCFDYFLGQERYYYPVIIFQILTAILMITVAVICYSQYFWLIQHVCARLCIIQYKIRQPFQIDHCKNNVLKKQLDLSNWIIDIIQYLSQTRNLMKLLNESSEKFCLFQTFMAFMLLIINFLCMFEIPLLMRHEETRKDGFAFLFFIVDTTFAIYVFSFIGQRLIDRSNDVYKEICLLPIYKISLKTQKIILTVLTTNAQPIAISIGKMFISSHEHFRDLLRLSLSFALMLHSTQQI